MKVKLLSAVVQSYYPGFKHESGTMLLTRILPFRCNFKLSSTILLPRIQTQDSSMKVELLSAVVQSCYLGFKHESGTIKCSSTILLPRIL